MNKKGYNKGMKKGSVSLYVVIFTTLLLSIISLGFLRVMLGEQQAASNQDLSNSAYDSAMAGVEDAKLVVLAYQECASRGFPSVSIRGMECTDVRSAVEREGCDTISLAHDKTIDSGRSETSVDQGFGDNRSVDLDQAYTCVTINSDTRDYLAQISSQKPSLVVPLRFKEEVRSIVVRWWRSEDADGAAPVLRDTCDDGKSCFPDDRKDWPSGPPVLRWQMINPDGDFFLQGPGTDDDDSLNARNTHASLFLVPQKSSGTTLVNYTVVTASGEAINNIMPYDQISIDGSGSTNGGHTPVAIKCNDNYDSNNGYACVARIDLPPTKSISAKEAGALLRLTAYYGETASVSVEGLNASGGTAWFDSVQPEIDSTGRASDLFRRVITRVGLTDAYFPFPEYALELTDANANLCKNFLVWPSGSMSLDNECH